MEPPAFIRLQVVVPVAQAGKIFEAGGTAVGEGDHVVDLETVANVASGHDADRITLDECRPERGRDRPRLRRDGDDPSAFQALRDQPWVTAPDSSSWPSVPLDS